MKIKKRSLFPKCLQKFKELKGIAVRECVAGLDMEDHAAHAHAASFDPYRGWICMKFKYHLNEKLTMLHEVAHLIVNEDYRVPHHGVAWRKKVVEIGGTYKPYTYKHGYCTVTYQDYTYHKK